MKALQGSRHNIITLYILVIVQQNLLPDLPASAPLPPPSLLLTSCGFFTTTPMFCTHK